MNMDQWLTIGCANQFQRDNGILVCAAAAYRGQDLPVGISVLLRSLAQFGIQIRFLGFDQQWNGCDQRRAHILNALRWFQNEYNYVLSIDVRDMVFIKPLEEIVCLARKYSKVTMHAERNCWPESGLVSKYPPCPTTYKYLNSGGYIGPLTDVITCLEKTIGLYNNDQGAWSIAYVNKLIDVRLDNQCEIFQSLFVHKEHELVWQGDQLYNRETRTYPCIIHANGSSEGTSWYQKFI